jgi:type VI secretion system secreted protein VgrG
VNGKRSLSVGGNAVEDIDGLEQRSVGGSAYLTVRGNHQLSVSGLANTVVGSRDKPSESAVAVWGKSTLFASDEIRLQSETSIVLECGESRVTLTPTEVRIEGKAIVVDGHESTTVFGKKPVMTFTDTVSLASDKITLTAQGASLALDSNATLLGGQVKLGSGSSASTATRKLDPAETKPFQVRLCNASQKPYANKAYEMMAGGQRFQGTTDGDGQVTEQVPKGAVLADLTLWIKPPPTGAHRRWQIHIEEQLPPATDVRGAQIRLKNLGYFKGDIDEQATGALGDALRAFQRDHDELPKDGALGGATLAKLITVHGH